MRVLMISDDYLPNPGGIAAHVYELSRALCRLGHEVDLLAGHDRRFAGGPVPALPAGGRVVRNRAFGWNPAGYALISVDTARRVRELVGAARYDVCHWHSLIWETPAVRVGAAGLPRVFTNHSSGFLRRMRSRWRRRLQLPLLLGAADEIITPSTELREQTIAAGVSADRVTMIANGVDVGDFAPGERDEELAKAIGLRPEHEVIVVPRRLDRKNGVDVLVRAMPIIAGARPAVRALLVGDGPERAQLEQLVASSGMAGHVIFCGSQPRVRMPAHLRLADVGVLPSRAEAISLAGLEMLAVGLPLVGSRVGGIPEFLDETAGRLVPPDDPGALAAAILDLLARPRAERAALGTTGRTRVLETYSWQAAAHQTLAVYTRAIGLRGHAGG